MLEKGNCIGNRKKNMVNEAKKLNCLKLFLMQKRCRLRKKEIFVLDFAFKLCKTCNLIFPLNTRNLG